jgi:hypothetical protein
VAWILVPSLNNSTLVISIGWAFTDATSQKNMTFERKNTILFKLEKDIEFPSFNKI